MGHQFEKLSSRVLAAAVDVHKALGPGFVLFRVFVIGLALVSLVRRPNHDVAAIRSRDGAAHEDQVVLAIDADDAQIP
jgi:hypothetical protein